MKNLIKSLIFVLSFIVLLPACKDDENDDNNPYANPDTQLTEAKSISLADTYNDDMQLVAAEAFAHVSSINKSTTDDYPSLSPCASINFNGFEFPMSISIDFGETNCLCLDGKYRRGAINMELSGPYTLAGSSVSITTSDYAVNDNLINGEILLTNLGVNDNGNLHFSAVSQLNITFSEANGAVELFWDGERYREWIEGADTPLDMRDDAFLITGSSVGTIGDVSVARLITSPLRKNIGCFYYVSGTVSVQNPLIPYTVDYGDGECDKIITVTVMGVEYTITLP